MWVRSGVTVDSVGCLCELFVLPCPVQMWIRSFTSAAAPRPPRTVRTDLAASVELPALRRCYLLCCVVCCSDAVSRVCSSDCWQAARSTTQQQRVDARGALVSTVPLIAPRPGAE